STSGGPGGPVGRGAGNGAAPPPPAGTPGSGYGGAVFVMNGATLTIKASTDINFTDNTTSVGTNGLGFSTGTPPAPQGQDIYINGPGQVITFQVDSGKVVYGGSSQPTEGNIAGAGGVTMTGLGTLVFGGVNTYPGPTTINNGPLSISSASNLGGTSLININAGTLQMTNTLTLTPDIMISTS